jgi:hypothetical protein
MIVQLETAPNATTTGRRPQRSQSLSRQSRPGRARQDDQPTPGDEAASHAAPAVWGTSMPPPDGVIQPNSVLSSSRSVSSAALIGRENR